MDFFELLFALSNMKWNWKNTLGCIGVVVIVGLLIWAGVKAP